MSLKNGGLSSEVGYTHHLSLIHCTLLILKFFGYWDSTFQFILVLLQCIQVFMETELAIYSFWYCNCHFTLLKSHSEFGLLMKHNMYTFCCLDCPNYKRSYNFNSVMAYNGLTSQQKQTKPNLPSQKLQKKGNYQLNTQRTVCSSNK